MIEIIYRIKCLKRIITFRFSKQMHDYRNSIVGRSIKPWYRHLLGRSLSLSAVLHNTIARWREEASLGTGYDGRRCYGKFKVGVKPSLVTNPSVVFRGIFNYRLNKISGGEGGGNEDLGGTIWRKTALTAPLTELYMSRRHPYTIASWRKKDGS